MPTQKTNQQDLVTEARELLVGITTPPWAYGWKTVNLTNIYAVGGRGSVADVSRWEDGIAGNEQENSANAHLIARAPELLRQLVEEVERRDKLIVHMHVHSGYRNNGYMQMTTEQKALYDDIWQRSVKALDEEEAQS